jgi:predicted transcriptional regulator of viral defense system
MNFQKFRNKWFDLGCISSDQIYAWRPDFDKNNISYWSKKGLIIKLRNGFYLFPEYKTRSGFAFYIANRIYRPSYISLHSALAFYGMIPESVVQITSVTSRKTATFSNAIGEFSYKTVKPDLMFGYDVKPMVEGHSFFLAKPEKALIDLLYLYPFYNTKSEIEELRLDMDFIQNDLNINLLKEYSKQIDCKALENRVKLIIN